MIPKIGKVVNEAVPTGDEHWGLAKCGIVVDEEEYARSLEIDKVVDKAEPTRDGHWRLTKWLAKWGATDHWRLTLEIDTGDRLVFRKLPLVIRQVRVSNHPYRPRKVKGVQNASATISAGLGLKLF